MQQPLSVTLCAIRKGDLTQSNSEFAVLEQFIETLKPIVEITKAIWGKKWVTISTIRPTLHKLLEVHI